MRLRAPHPGIRWLRRVGRVLAVVAQLVVLLAPAAESREERMLAAHAEQQGAPQHPGHHPERCPACILLAVHSRAAERQELPPFAQAGRVRPPVTAEYATVSADAPANSCRAPPTLV